LICNNVLPFTINLKPVSVKKGGLFVERVILHADLNNFYATVECMLNPQLKDKPVVVCGNPAHRHGIVLAKNEIAKSYGIKTGDVLWEAKQKCPGLIGVPPNFPVYLQLSQKVREIYSRYTDQVEPFGIDECWLDVTGSTHLFGSGEEIALALRRAVFRELNLTVSIGVSFNKVFAKLGSDYKKPDATTVITPDNYQEIVWPLDVSELFFVGPATARKLRRYGIFTIGQLAQADPCLLQKLLGINGKKIWLYARGLDQSPVLRPQEMPEALSVGHGITCVKDLYTPQEAKEVLTFLAQRLARRLRKMRKTAGSVNLYIRCKDLSSQSHQKSLPVPGRSCEILVRTAMEILTENYFWHQPIRALSIQAFNLIDENSPRQLSFWDPLANLEKRERLEAVTDELRLRYGPNIINRASQLLDIKVPKDYQGDYAVLPGARV